eukprot:TRINITY_DN10953_c2_g1_i1.p1 TRINITY_DN10953_c2_g1~~TRINITY_DN10953_c2_g1_i1.p1  ORF type:complete len:281 (+),score=99.00 TRINITY_DN10953_c2_g1_i1:59-844(+)
MAGKVAGMASLANKTVAVTGASGGIGAVIVETLVKYGCTVRGVGTARSADKLKELEASTNGKFKGFTADFSSAEDCLALPAKLGKVDMLVNGHGIAAISPLMEQTADDWDKTMNINSRSVFLLSQAFAKQWIEDKKAGTIVNLSSQASMAPLPGHTTYCASKAAVDMLTRMLAMELGPHQIRVNAVNPTVVLTDMGRANWSDPKVASPMLHSIPLERFAEADEVSEAVAFLLSDSAGMINGHLLPIDGGFLACRSNLMKRD